jgi:hypothetical protein
MDQFLDAAVFATGTTTTTTNGKKSSTGTGPVSPVTSPILSASASGGTRVCIYIYIFECVSSSHLLDFVVYVVKK